MPVLKHISPVVVPIFPMAVPRKTEPSCKTSRAGIFVELTSRVQISVNYINHLFIVGKM
jgi:hypothetical protein